MKRKRLLTSVGSIGLILVLAALLIVAGPAPASAKQIELRFSFQHGPKAGKYVRGHKPWAESVEKATKGRVKVVIYPSNSLAKARENYDATIDGIVDIGWIAIPHYKGRFPLTEAFSIIPGSGIKDPIIASQIIWSLYKKFPEIRAEFKDVKVLTMHAFAPRSIGAKRRVRTVEDVKGMKIRAAGGEAQMLEAAGASPVFMVPGDMYLNFQKGVIDAVTMGWEGHGAFGMIEIARYYTVFPAFPGPMFVLFMNKNKWNKLPADIQEAIMSVSGDAGSRLYAEGDFKTSQMVIDQIRKKGGEILTLTPEEGTRWEGFAKPMQDKLIGALEKKGLPARAFFNEILRMAKEYKD